MFTDSHCHLDFQCFKPDLSTLLNDCHKVGVDSFLVPSTTQASWANVIELSNRHPQIRIALGLHPYFLKDGLGEYRDELESALAHPAVVAVGEIGLDKWQGMPDYGLQQRIYYEQLCLAKGLGLPIILHARKSEDDLLKVIRQLNFQHGGIVHAFNGSLQQAKQFIDFGFVLGIGGTVTYPRAQKAQRVLAALSDTDFVLETDSPDMPLYGYQGQRNTPEKILLVAESVAKIRGQSLTQLAQNTRANLQRVLPNWHEV